MVYCMEQTGPTLDVVYEDDDVLLVNKRAGVSVEAGRKGRRIACRACCQHVSRKAPDAPVAHRLSPVA